MLAICVHEFGGPEVLKLEEKDTLLPSTTQVLVKIQAAGVNPVDTYIRSGQYPIQPSLPYTPGLDAAGEIVSIGEDIKVYQPGDRVYLSGSLTGTYAQETLCSARQICPLPDNVSFEQGAAIGVPYATAFRALFTKARAVDGETVLVHGASGGVGLAAVQLAKQFGLKVLATAGSLQGQKLVRQNGADEVFDHSSSGSCEAILEAVRGQGVDIILEMLANVNLPDDLRMIGPGGRIIVIGCRGEVNINPRELMGKDAAVMGMSLFNATDEEKSIIYHKIEDGLVQGYLNPVVGQSLTMAQAAQAHEQVMASGAKGKIVLVN